MKNILYRVRTVFQPYIIMSVALILIATVLLWSTFILQNKYPIIASICANISAGLITGIVLLVISNLKNIEHHRLNRYYAYLDTIRSQISNCLLLGAKTIGNLHSKNTDMYNEVYKYLDSCVGLVECIENPDRYNKKILEELRREQIWNLETFNSIICKELEASHFDKSGLNQLDDSQIIIRWSQKIIQLNSTMLSLESFILKEIEDVQVKIAIYNNPIL